MTTMLLSPIVEDLFDFTSHETNTHLQKLKIDFLKIPFFKKIIRHIGFVDVQTWLRQFGEEYDYTTKQLINLTKLQLG